jgi:N-acetylglutamate synthase-like GNAT family acetyltransferase
MLNKELIRKLPVTSPSCESEMEQYFDLRWRILRAPWNQPKGSEREPDDESAFHAMICFDKKVIACGRLHRIDEKTAQVRFMAVETEFQGMGLGKKLLDFLEQYARKILIEKIILQAREEAIPFYLKNGYSIVKKTGLLFGCIQHYLMEKNLTESFS